MPVDFLLQINNVYQQIKFALHTTVCHSHSKAVMIVQRNKQNTGTFIPGSINKCKYEAINLRYRFWLTNAFNKCFYL